MLFWCSFHSEFVVCVMDRIRRFLTFGIGVAGCAALLIAVIWVEEDTASAQQGPSGSVTPTLRLAGSGFGPVPANTVLSRDELSNIASRMRARKWPIPSVQPSWPLVDGQPIIETKQLNQLHHTVQRGETLERLRQMWRVSTRELQRLNPDIDLYDLEEGQRLLVWVRDEDKLAKSYGYPHYGRLYNGEPLPPSENYVILYPYRTFGTYYAVSEIRRVMREFYDEYPDTHRLMVGDISYRNGRRMPPHKSHQSGRDVDISYPRKGEPDDLDRFHYVRRDELHPEKTLALIKKFIDGGQVQYIFMSRWFQRILIREAREQGAPEAWIDAVFQYPHWSGGDALIRHSSGHRNHFHLRFKCQETDRRCRP